MKNKFENMNTIVGLIIILALLFFCGGVAIYQALLPVVTLKVNNVTIRQEETLPKFEVHAEYNGKEDIVLDETKGYRLSDLIEEWNQGKGYSLSHHVDTAKEGAYTVQLNLEESLKEKLQFLWNYKVQYQIETGIVSVLNKYGDWEGDRFKMLDGTYASGWTNLGDDTYFFDENGERVKGKQTINGNEYYFHENGKFDIKRNRVNPNRPMIALTFDDGPGPYTMQLLEQLEAHHSRATFFLVGRNIGKYPEVLSKMAEIGCELGNHTTNHARLSQFPAETIIYEIQSTNESIQSIVGQQERILVRPPYGATNETVQYSANAPLIMWSVDTRDWELKDVALVRDYVLNTAKDGEIILLHDIHETTVQAALEFIPQLVKQGYQIVTVSDMAKARGVSLENGIKYYKFRMNE